MYITFQKYFRALTIELCINPIYEKTAMKQSVVLVLIVALLVTGLETLVLVQVSEASSSLVVSDVHENLGLTPEELNALTDSIFGETAVPGRGPSIPNIPGSVPGETYIPSSPGPSIPNIPSSIFGTPDIGGGPPNVPGIPGNIFGP